MFCSYDEGALTTVPVQEVQAELVDLPRVSAEIPLHNFSTLGQLRCFNQPEKEIPQSLAANIDSSPPKSQAQDCPPCGFARMASFIVPHIAWWNGAFRTDVG